MNKQVWEYNGISKTVIEWGEELGLTPHCLIHRHKELGWSLEKTLTTKKGERKHG